MPDLQTWINNECKAKLTGPKAHFSSLGGGNTTTSLESFSESAGGILPEPVARPFFNFLMPRIILPTVVSLVLTFGSGTAEMDSDSRDVEVVDSAV